MTNKSSERLNGDLLSAFEHKLSKVITEIATSEKSQSLLNYFNKTLEIATKELLLVFFYLFLWHIGLNVSFTRTLIVYSIHLFQSLKFFSDGRLYLPLFLPKRRKNNLPEQPPGIFFCEIDLTDNPEA